MINIKDVLMTFRWDVKSVSFIPSSSENILVHPGNSGTMTFI